MLDDLLIVQQLIFQVPKRNVMLACPTVPASILGGKKLRRILQHLVKKCKDKVGTMGWGMIFLQ